MALYPERLGPIEAAENGWFRPVEFARLLGSTPYWIRGILHPAALLVATTTTPLPAPRVP